MSAEPEAHLSSAATTPIAKHATVNTDDLILSDSAQEEPGSEALNGDNSIIQVEAVATDAPAESIPGSQDDTNGEESASPNPTLDKHEATQEDTEMEDTKSPENIADLAPASEDAVSQPLIAETKSKVRRKSSAALEYRTKKLNKKAVKPRTTHIDAKPGDYFYVRLKGYPLWPAVVCDETMLPTTLLKSRPVTAARPDGTYREEFMDGGPKAKDRSFPVLYLFTNELSSGWIPNYDLLEIDFDEIGNVTGTMRKDLVMARQLAAEKHDLDYFKDILKSFMETREEERLNLEKSKEEKRSQKEKKREMTEKKKTPRKPRKSKITVADENEDIPMIEDNVHEDAGKSTLNPSTKRPAEEQLKGPPKKKPTIKLTTKTNIGNLNAKPLKPAAPKKQKAEKPEKASKSKKPRASKGSNIEHPLEPEPTAEEIRVKKEKEILFLRHKLQKGLLNKDQELKEEEMQAMSDFVDKLEAYTDLEVSIIRQTKINKVLKAILKISSIPKEEEYHFKPRSHNLLEKWNKILASDGGRPAVVSSLNVANSEGRNGSEESKTVSRASTKNSTEEKTKKKKHSETPSKKSSRASNGTSGSPSTKPVKI